MVSLQELKSWAKHHQVFIDVRSPSEFAQGHLPGAVNAPILNDQERAAVGLTYKTKGREAALELGYKIVSGENRAHKIIFWKGLADRKGSVILTCFRGGLRSQIAQQWLREEGYDFPLIAGGYKQCRSLLTAAVDDYCNNNKFLLISGATGAAKTRFLKKLASSWPTLDLEGYAHHRGSAFGKMEGPQPQQAVFENRIAWDLLRNIDQAESENLPFLVEDESRLIGRCVQPVSFYQTLRESPIVWLDVSLDERVENTFEDYIELPLAQKTSNQDGLALFARYKRALFDIQNRLGGARYKELADLINTSEESWLKSRETGSNRLWIRCLLEEYYDPLYFGSLDRREPSIQFKGSTAEALDFLAGIKSNSKAKVVKEKATTT